MELIEAAKEGNYEKFNNLVLTGSNINYVDADGLDVIMHAAANGHYDFMVNALKFHSQSRHKPRYLNSEIVYFDKFDRNVNDIYMTHLLIIGVINGHNYHQKNPELWKNLKIKNINTVANAALHAEKYDLFKYFAMIQYNLYLYCKECNRIDDISEINKFLKTYTKYINAWTLEDKWFPYYETFNNPFKVSNYEYAISYMNNFLRQKKFHIKKAFAKEMFAKHKENVEEFEKEIVKRIEINMKYDKLSSRKMRCLLAILKIYMETHTPNMIKSVLADLYDMNYDEAIKLLALEKM